MPLYNVRRYLKRRKQKLQKFQRKHKKRIYFDSFPRTGVEKTKAPLIIIDRLFYKNMNGLGALRIRSSISSVRLLRCDRGKTKHHLFVLPLFLFLSEWVCVIG